MPRSKVAIVYLCLVGVPLLGMVAILRAGQHLVAPLFVSGAWNVEADVSTLASDACRDLLFTIDQPFVTVSQSGSDLTVRLGDPNRTVLPGHIQGTTLRIGADDAQTEDCRNAAAIRLQGTVSGRPDQRVVIGTLTVAGCASCQSTPFRAFRVR